MGKTTQLPRAFDPLSTFYAHWTHVFTSPRQFDGIKTARKIIRILKQHGFQRAMAVQTRAGVIVVFTQAPPGMDMEPLVDAMILSSKRLQIGVSVKWRKEILPLISDESSIIYTWKCQLPSLPQQRNMLQPS